MKTGILTTKTIASDDIKDNKSIMGMSAKGMEMAQYFLRDKIYSNKILAVVREYISNAQDEHIKHAIINGVDVSLKTVDGDWVWSVRDYANGLNDHDIRNIFGVYFESTKSNENNSIGGFGIGGKAGFSYLDTFYVTSHHNGVKTGYVCTLGAGTKGIPVGEIYEISQEPTIEQGIEISINVKNSDLYDFSQITSHFIRYFLPDSNIAFDDKYKQEVITPISPVSTNDINGYKFNSYDTVGLFSRTTYHVRMGGVIYPHTTATMKRRNFSNYVVVDVPIGKLTIPISRESVENTPLNDRVFQEIEDTLDKMEEDEISRLTVPMFGSIITGNHTFGVNYNGGWFKHNFRDCFPTSSKGYYKTSRIWDDPCGTTSIVNTGAVKYAVYIMPSINNLKNWHKRLITALKKIKGDDYNGYVYIKKHDYEQLIQDVDKFIDLSDCTFIDVKKLKLPALDKKVNSDTVEYLVYDQYARKDYFTAQSLDDEVREKFFDGNELENDWHLEVESMTELDRRTIGNAKVWGTRCRFRTANSKKMIENLVGLGWLTPDSDEYNNIKDKFDEKYRAERLVIDATSKLERLYYGIKPTDRMRTVIKNNPDKLQRLEAVKNAILLGDTARSRILKSLDGYYNSRITRQDLRKILLITD